MVELIMGMDMASLRPLGMGMMKSVAPRRATLWCPGILHVVHNYENLENLKIRPIGGLSSKKG